MPSACSSASSPATRTIARPRRLTATPAPPRSIEALAGHLAGRGITRIDTGCHRANAAAWRFYAHHGFHPLDEERLARVL